VKTLIAIPCTDMVHVDFMTSMINLRKTEDTAYAVQANSMIYDSRNSLAAKALVNNYDRVLWLDSDLVFEADLLERLSKDMDDKGLEFVTALAFKRHLPTGPCIYKELVYKPNKAGLLISEAKAYKDYPVKKLFRVAGAGFGAVLVKCALLRDVWERYGPPFDPMTQMGEDLSFCWRVTQLGRKMWCDSTVKVGHIGQYIYSETDYKREGGESE